MFVPRIEIWQLLNLFTKTEVQERKCRTMAKVLLQLAEQVVTSGVRNEDRVSLSLKYLFFSRIEFIN